MKKITLLLLTSISLLLCLQLNAFATNDIAVKINNEAVIFDQKPIIENDRTLVPIRAIAEKMLFDVDYEHSTQKITLKNFNTVLTLYVNQNSISKELIHASQTYIDKTKTISLDVPAKIIEGRTYVPLRAISELFGATVDWDNSTHTANISYALTSGEPVEFIDKGIEQLCRIAITLGDIDTTDENNLNDETTVAIGSNTLKLYEGVIYNSALKNITTLGVRKGYTFPVIVNSIEDISKFPKLENLYLEGQNVRDLSPITFKTTWNEIEIEDNPIFDFEPLTKIQVNHYIYAGYYDYVFSYINNDYEKNSTLSNTEQKKYDKFASTLAEIFLTFQNVIKENITDEMTRKEKIEVVNNWIIQNIKYDDNLDYFNNITNFYTTIDENYYGKPSDTLECSILHGYAQCYGYAEVFGIFCDILNIPCIEVYGDAFNGEWVAHAWNIVKLEDNKLYHVDTTWNCSNNNYCLISNEEISIDHVFEKEDIPKYFKYRKEQYHFFNSDF